MESTKVIDIEGTEFEELEEFTIACFEDNGGLMCMGDEGTLYGNWDGFDFNPTKFLVHKEEDKYYIKCEHGHYVSFCPVAPNASELNCSNDKPEGDRVVYLEPSEHFNSIFRFRTSGGGYTECDWVKANYGSLYTRGKEDGTLFYLRSVNNR